MRFYKHVIVTIAVWSSTPSPLIASAACTAPQQERMAQVCSDLQAVARARHAYYAGAKTVAASRSDDGQASVSAMSDHHEQISRLQSELLELFTACQVRKCPVAAAPR